MTKLNEIEIKFKCSEEDRQVLKNEIRQNRNENLLCLSKGHGRKATTDVGQGRD